MINNQAFAKTGDFVKLLTFGEVLWDVYPDKKHIGGAVMNFSAHAARLGTQVFFASAVGDDNEGQEALRFMEEYGINTACVGISPEYETGKCLVILDNNGIPSYNLLQNTAYDYIPLPKGEYDVLCFGTLALRSKENRETIKKLLRNSYREIFADINIRPPFISPESLALCLENATVIKASDEDLQCISSYSDPKEAIAEIMQSHRNIRLGAVTLGEKGSFVYDGKTFIYCDAVKTEVSSTVGAGDSFSAAFLVNLLNGKDIPHCLDTAARLSSFVVSQSAAIPDYDPKEYI